MSLKQCEEVWECDAAMIPYKVNTHFLPFSDLNITFNGSFQDIDIAENVK